MILDTSELDSFDPESMENAVRGAAIRHVQLGRGRFLARLLSIQAGPFRLDHGRYNLPLHANGCMPDRRVTLGFVLDGTGRANFNGHAIEQPVPVVLREGAELDFVLAPRSEWLALQVERPALEAVGIFAEHFDDGPGVLPDSVTTHARHCVRQAVASLRAIAAGENAIISPEAYCENILTSMFDYFVAMLQRADVRSTSAQLHPARARHVVRHAIEYMNEHVGGTVQIGLMCAELEISYKTLERAFVKCHGVTPKRYLQFARLARARRLLLNTRRTGQSITEIAESCGIHHLSRFAQLYRATYGELPSTTVSRRSARHTATLD